ncbi:MAG: YbjN domain-containing protein [Acidihalobacter sp.]
MNGTMRKSRFCTAALRLFAALGVLSMLSYAGGVQAESLISTMTTDRLQHIMTGEGYAVSSTGRSGQLLWKIDGYSAYVYLQGNGRIIKFRKGFSGKVSLETVNAWNRTKRYSTSFVDSEGRPNLKMYLALDGGVSEARLKDYLKTCRTSFVVWVRHLRAAQ